MVLYDFIDEETGAHVEIDFAIADRPPLDEVIEHEGRRVRRVMAAPNLGPVRDWEFVSRALPRENPRNPKWPCDEQGHPRFKGLKHGKMSVAEYVARSDGRAVWDGFEDPTASG